jgi:hypothetical protein
MRLAAIVFASVATSAVLAGGAAPVTSFKPVSFAILEDYDKGESFADVEKDFALFNELDISTWRGSFGWDDYEPSRGKYEFEWLHRFAERAAARGIELRPYLGYTPEWAARASGTDKDAWNNPPADLQRWERFAGAMARALRQHPNVRSYEIYNEENVRQWWDGTAQEYARVLVRGARAIRRQDRDAHVLFGGLVFPDKEWIEDVCATSTVRGSFDVLPFHAYPETWTPPEVTAENYLGGLDAFAATADEVCGRRRNRLRHRPWEVRTGSGLVVGSRRCHVPRAPAGGAHRRLRDQRPSLRQARDRRRTQLSPGPDACRSYQEARLLHRRSAHRPSRHRDTARR